MWFGADPGGKRCFGVACLSNDGTFETDLVSGADEAVAWILDRDNPIDGLGIDCPLWWSSQGSSDRHADKWLRRQYRDLRISRTIQAANSLQGAVLIQGMMLAYRIRKRRGNVPITEAHPKVLTKALGIAGWEATSSYFELVDREPGDFHQRDALLAAIAAKMGFTGAWKRDLAEERDLSELKPSEMWFGNVRYFWPE